MLLAVLTKANSFLNKGVYVSAVRKHLRRAEWPRGECAFVICKKKLWIIFSSPFGSIQGFSFNLRPFVYTQVR